MAWGRSLSEHHRLYIAVLTLLGTHAVLLAWSATKNSPTIDEVNHLPAGVSHLCLGRFICTESIRRWCEPWRLCR